MASRKKDQREIEMTSSRKLDESRELTRDQPVFIPATDVYECEDSTLIRCDMPGVAEDSIDITLENGVLTITGYQDTDEPEGYDLLHRGYTPGVFRRAFTLVREVDGEAIEARLRSGVLELVLPKAERPGPRKIPVTT